MRIGARLLLAISLAICLGCAKQDWIDRTLVTMDVTGTWHGFGGGGGVGSREVVFDLEQQGSTVKGSMRIILGASQNPFGFRPGPIEGTVAGDVFRFKQTNGTAEGELTVSGDEMNGRATIGIPDRLYLRRVDPSSPPASPPR